MMGARFDLWSLGSMATSTRRFLAAMLATSTLGFLASAPAFADKIPNHVAVFSFLDKVTARISSKAIPLNTTVEFGTLKVTPRACFTRPPTEEPKTTTFVEVDDQKLDGTTQRIFSGWMLAQSPGLHAVEHPVYDVWLTDCQKPATNAAEAADDVPADPTLVDGAPADEPAVTKHRVKRQ
jgi:hypothetical protein